MEAILKAATRTISPVGSASQLRQISWLRDLPAMLVIEKASFANPWTLLDFLRFNCKSHTSGRIRILDGQVVGYLLYEKHFDRLHVAHVAVRPDCRSLGIGREMIRSLADRSRCYVTLHVRKSNLNAQRLYHRLGFEVVRELPHHYCDCEDAFLMGYSGL